jgi:peptidyl-prolyl cis-trans isomerase C
LQEARRRGLENDPEVRAAIEKILVHKLTRDYSEQQDKSNPIPEAEVRRYYEQHKAEFVSPTRVRISHLFLAAPEGDPKRAKATAEATKLLAQIFAKEAKGQKQVLETTASQRSEDAATKATGGDLGFKTREELAQAWGQPLADAALALKSPNDIGPVVATSKGIHLIKLLGRHEGYETPFETARSRIEPRLKQQRQTVTLDALIAELKKTTKVTIDEKALAKVNVSSSQPAQRAVGSGPTHSDP